MVVSGSLIDAVEAAGQYAHQVGNQVTLSYRKECFTRLKDRNENRIQECMQKGKVNVIFNSMPVEFKQSSVILDVNGKSQEIPNDFVWIFAGGAPPYEFLRKIGVGFGMREMAVEAEDNMRRSQEASNRS